MSEESVEIASPEPAATFTWSEAWIQAVTKPAVATFEKLIRDPKASTRRAFLWVFLVSLIGFAVVLIGQMVFGGPAGGAMFGRLGGGEAAVIFFCQTPIVAALAVVGLIINAGVTTLIARALGGKGTFTKQAYAVACYTAPLSLVSSVLGAFPILVYLGSLLGFYGIALNIISVKAVHGFEWWKAVVSSVIILVGILVLVAVITIAVLALMGPAIQDVFNNVLQGLGTPAP